MVLEVLQLKRPSLLYNVSVMRFWFEQVKNDFYMFQQEMLVRKHEHW